jgi:hypothetical protein
MHLNHSGSANGGELAKAIPHIVVEIIEYVNNAVVSKTILKKSFRTDCLNYFYLKPSNII